MHQQSLQDDEGHQISIHDVTVHIKGIRQGLHPKFHVALAICIESQLNQTHNGSNGTKSNIGPRFAEYFVQLNIDDTTQPHCRMLKKENKPLMNSWTAGWRYQYFVQSGIWPAKELPQQLYRPKPFDLENFSGP